MEFVLNNIKLSGLTPADEEDIVTYMQDKGISEGTSRIPFPYTIDDARLWINDNLTFEEENGFKRNYAIRSEDGKMLGCIGLHFNYGLMADKSEFGYWLGKPHRNKGVMTRAINLFAELVKQQHGLLCLEAHVFSFNLASQKTLKKAGFTECGYIAGFYIKNDAHIGAIKFEKILK